MGQNQWCLCRRQETGNKPVCGMILTETLASCKETWRSEACDRRRKWNWNGWSMRFGLQLDWKLLCVKEGRQIFLTTPGRVQSTTSWGKKQVQSGGVTEDNWETRGGQQGLLTWESKSVGDQIRGKGVRWGMEGRQKGRSGTGRMMKSAHCTKNGYVRS